MKNIFCDVFFLKFWCYILDVEILYFVTKYFFSNENAKVAENTLNVLYQ